MLENIRRYGSTITVFNTKDLDGDIALRLGSSGSIKNMNTLRYDDIDKTQYKEICRINGSIYSSDNGIYQANGWEVSDMYKQANGVDSWHEFIMFKDGSFKVGDINRATINLNDVEFAYSVDAVVLNNGEEVCQCASHREKYFVQKHPRTFWGITANGEYVFCTACGRLTNEQGLTGDEVREVLKEYGCVWGFMNDGGKCSQMMIDGKLVNKTVTGGYYQVRNALFVYHKASADTNTHDEQLKAENARLTAENAKLKAIIVSIKNLVA